MFGLLNKSKYQNEHRYILCNFIDQNSDMFGIGEDIYMTNHEKSLEQLFLMAYNGALKNDMIDFLFEEYYSSIQAIESKIEIL